MADVELFNVQGEALPETRPGRFSMPAPPRRHDRIEIAGRKYRVEQVETVVLVPGHSLDPIEVSYRATVQAVPNVTVHLD